MKLVYLRKKIPAELAKSYNSQVAPQQELGGGVPPTDWKLINNVSASRFISCSLVVLSPTQLEPAGTEEHPSGRLG